MFKNAIVYRIGPDWQMPSLEDLQTVLQRLTFAPCGPTEEESSGWVAPRPQDHSPMAEYINDQLILKLMVERKSVPASAVKNELERRCKQIELERGRKPLRKEKKELKEDILLEFLPRAFAKRSSHIVWIDPTNRFIVVGTGSRRAADHVVDQVVDMLAATGSVLPIAMLNTQMSPSAAMAHWLTTMEAPYSFTVDRDLELKQPDNEQSVVRYARHNLEIEEVVQHITSGKLPTQLALTWLDDGQAHVSFVLSADLALRKIELLDDVFKDSDEGAGFDGDVALATGELSKLLPALINALGGEVEESAEDGETESN